VALEGSLEGAHVAVPDEFGDFTNRSSPAGEELGCPNQPLGLDHLGEVPTSLRAKEHAEVLALHAPFPREFDELERAVPVRLDVPQHALDTRIIARAGKGIAVRETMLLRHDPDPPTLRAA
jgi:hypothetical protein